MIKTIYLDMDGVIADFEKGVKDIGALEDGKIVWSKIHKVGPDFWANLDWMPASQTFYTWLKGFCKENKIDLCILSAAGIADYKATERGKQDWLDKNCADIGKQNRYIVQTGNGKSAAQCKAKFAAETALLIDDFSKNINAFIMAGGQGLLCRDLKKVREAILDMV